MRRNPHPALSLRQRRTGLSLVPATPHSAKGLRERGRGRVRGNFFRLIFILAAIFFLFPSAISRASNELALRSSAFKEAEAIPAKYTCEGKNVSPPLRWANVPAAAQSLVLLLEDPDAPAGTFTHWLLYNLPPAIDMLPEALPSILKLANGERHAKNDFGITGYGGPCPPQGAHRYFFRIFALDIQLPLEAGAPYQEVRRAMESHILARGELMGRYEKNKKPV